jgi:hypothetical protein
MQEKPTNGERLSRKKGNDRDNRDNRDTSNGAASRVSATEIATETTETNAAAVVRLVACETCRHFRPDPINPPAGVGICAAGVGHLSIGRALHPMAPRYCAGHEVAG